jgi:3-methyladenine DNA glycosylase AlkC
MNTTSVKDKSKLSQNELTAIRNKVEQTLSDYYKKKSEIFYNVVNKK